MDTRYSDEPEEMLQLRRQLEEIKRDNEDQREELMAQKEELTAAIEQVMVKNRDLEDALKKLQKRNLELDQILYRASHDLKTPVASMEGLIELMRAELINSAQEEILEYMELKVSHMNDVLKSMTMLAQASFGKIHSKKILLNKIVSSVIRDLSYLTNYKNVSIDIVYNGVEYVFSDEVVLYNILRCLLSNSIAYTDFLRRGFITASFKSDDTSLTIAITDDGEGISPAISSRIFDMFFRGSEKSHGQGMGLYIVKNIVDRIQGDISWTSEKGKTTFQVVLPRQLV